MTQQRTGRVTAIWRYVLLISQIFFLQIFALPAHAAFPATEVIVPNRCTVAPCYWYQVYRIDDLTKLLEPRQPSAQEAADAFMVTVRDYVGPANANRYRLKDLNESWGFNVVSVTNLGQPNEYEILWTQRGFVKTSRGPDGKTYRCPNPDTATLSGTECTCKLGYVENAIKTDCIPIPLAIVDRSILTAPPENQCSAGNPIYPLTASKFEKQSLGIQLAWKEAQISYDTRRFFAASAVNGRLDILGAGSDFGQRWTGSFHRKLMFNAGSLGVHVLDDEGFTVSFSFDPALGKYVSEAGAEHALEFGADIYTYSNLKKQVVETYDLAGRILTQKNGSGSVLTYEYSAAASAQVPAAGYLVRVTDPSGRAIRFEYTLPVGGFATKDGRVTKIIAPDERAVLISYDAAGNLASLSWPDGKSRHFHYEISAFPWALTGITDEKGVRYANFEYDSQGFARSTEHVGGINRYELSFSSPLSVLSETTYNAASGITFVQHGWALPPGVSVGLPNGQSQSIAGISINGAPAMTGQSQAAGSGCSASVNGRTYDASGNVLSRDDFQGKRSCYAYDNKDREIVRVEGLANTVACASVLPGGATLPAGARKITTSWHPDWHLPKQVDAPLLRTSTVYHGQPDPFNGNTVASCSTTTQTLGGKPLPLVCKQVEQVLLSDGTLAPTVGANSRTYSYDSAGKVITDVDTNDKTTSYSYYADAEVIQAEPYDVEYERVSLLLRGNGAEGSTAVADSSQRNHSVTTVGNAKISTTQSRFGGAALAFDGTGDYLSIPNHTSFGVTTEPSTIEFWFYIAGNSVQEGGNGNRTAALINANAPSSGATINAWFVTLLGSTSATGTGIRYTETDASGNWYSAVKNYAFAHQTWYHLAVVRSAAGAKLYINGVQQTSDTDTIAAALRPAYSVLQPIWVGAENSPGYGRNFNGAIDDLRITKGKARYTASFTPPTAEFPNHGPISSPDDTGHAIGDLKNITNAAGHVTQYTQYDRVGRVRQMIDPKGVVTDITYTPRGWVNTVSVAAPGAAARLTTYVYDGVGQLTGVAQPDGSTLSYTYDAAHRLVGVTDAKGNSVTYTLDNAGNKTAEAIKDPSGVLQRSLARSFDALNRVQQVTGGAR